MNKIYQETIGNMSNAYNAFYEMGHNISFDCKADAGACVEGDASGRVLSLYNSLVDVLYDSVGSAVYDEAAFSLPGVNTGGMGWHG